MKERPILFNGEMVRAVLSGQKTQTRRVIKPQPFVGCEPLHVSGQFSGSVYSASSICDAPAGCSDFGICPYGRVGDRLWVRECISKAHRRESGEGPVYRADMPTEMVSHFVWKPSIHMPRWASRIMLDVTGVRVERVQDITEEDAKAEGIQPERSDYSSEDSTILQFRDLWNSINSKRGYGWDVNPWVWVVEFRMVEE